MKYTDNYNLHLPEGEDFYDIADDNFNATTVDAELKTHTDEITALTSRVSANESNISANTSSIATHTSEISTINSDLSSIGKLLWSGNFTSGSINVPGLSNYTLLAVVVDNVLCLGLSWGGYGGIGAYNSYGSTTRAYRFTVNSDTVTIDDNCRGGSDGSQTVPVTKIYGVF